uniref:hypothetical protein n=1 Tax=Scandinavium goeteborgense TaxID=1851514 RepID=UPI00135C56E0|nr:hypothetical protein [Scandinavium goeteborgense]
MSTPLVDSTSHSEAKKSIAERSFCSEITDFWRFMGRLITGFRSNAVEDSERINAMIDKMTQDMSKERLIEAIKILGREISLGSAEKRHHGMYGYPWDKG